VGGSTDAEFGEKSPCSQRHRPDDPGGHCADYRRRRSDCPDTSDGSPCRCHGAPEASAGPTAVGDTTSVAGFRRMVEAELAGEAPVGV
jgi:hypothetical protein